MKNAEFAFRHINYLFFPVGGSHYLLLDEISQNLHQHGHDVRMLLQLGNPVITGIYGKVFNSLYPAVATCHNLRYIAGFSYVGGADSYQKSAWSLGDKYIKEYNDWFLEQQKQFLLGRYQKIYIGLFLSH